MASLPDKGLRLKLQVQAKRTRLNPSFEAQASKKLLKLKFQGLRLKFLVQVQSLF